MREARFTFHRGSSMIEFHHVTKRYPGQERPTLEDLSFHIKKGEFCVLAGPSGAGKTTLLKLLFCAERASYGRILLRSQDIAALPLKQIPYVRRQVGVVFQDFKLVGNLTALENVSMALWVQGRPADEVRKKSIALLQQVGLSARIYSLCAHLSGGEQQRVAIARALVGQPSLLLCDEPTGNLDARRASETIELLAEANRAGATVLLATHDPELLEHQHRRVISLHNGRLAQPSRSQIPVEA